MDSLAAGAAGVGAAAGADSTSVTEMISPSTSSSSRRICQPPRSAVDIDEREVDVGLGGGEVELLANEDVLKVKDAFEGDGAFAVLDDCQVDRFLRGFDGATEAFGLFLRFDEANQGVFDFVIGFQNRLLIVERRLLEACFVARNVVLQPAVVEQVPVEAG